MRMNRWQLSAARPGARAGRQLARAQPGGRWVVTALATVLALAGCRNTASFTEPVPVGSWGGLQGTLVIYTDSATLDLPCAAGRIPGGLAPGDDGSFQVAGAYAIQAGPVSKDGPVWRPALYSGRRDGDRIELNITMADSIRIGPFSFERGVVKMFPRCL